MIRNRRKNPAGEHPFTHIAWLQRGHARSAETTMLALQKLLPGVIHTAIEHGGDFLWRMTETNAHHLGWGREAVLNKANRILRQIEGQKPGGWTWPFERELEANIEAQSEYIKGRLSPAQIRQKLDRLLRLYVKRHAALPVYNRAQKLAREASVAIGTAMLKRRLSLAEPALRRLVKAASRKQTWEKEAGSMSLAPVKTNPRRNPVVQLPPDFFQRATEGLRKQKAIRDEIYEQSGVWYDDLDVMMDDLSRLQAKYLQSKIRVVKGNPPMLTLLAPNGYKWATYAQTARKGWIRVQVWESADFPYPKGNEGRDRRLVFNKVLGKLKAKQHHDSRFGRGWRKV